MTQALRQLKLITPYKIKAATLSYPIAGSALFLGGICFSEHKVPLILKERSAILNDGIKLTNSTGKYDIKTVALLKSVRF